MVLRRLLIANRGEIAARIITTCQRLGIETVLAASDADIESVPARLADHTVRLGPAKAEASYLNVDAVVDAARVVGAQAIHPGYGFLAENRRLAHACENAGLVFVGPTVAQLDAVGDKLTARAHAVEAGLPVAAGGEATDAEAAQRLAADIGWPVLVKAVGGGGGRGMKQVDRPDQLAATVEQAMSEAHAAFGDARVYLERFVPAGRHVEVQLLGDGHRVVHVGDRDCSVQRRYQKLVEEAPAPDLTEELRTEMRQAAVRFGEHLGYRGLGTVEFLVDRQHDTFLFLEMNARIQVEHPVTEAVSGLDLVAEQLAVAEGQPLRMTQDQVALAGHAIECRLNAEDWAADFRPDPGTVKRAVWPAGVGIRVDTHVQAGEPVQPFYDSLVAKLIVWGQDRGEALTRLQHALARCDIDGVATTLPLHRELVAHADVVAGAVDTGWLARFLAARSDPTTHPTGGHHG